MESMALPEDAKIGPNCGLTAIAVACGITLAEAEEAYLKALGRKMSGNWKGRTYDHVRKKALREHLSHLVTVEDVALPFKRMGKNMGLKAWMKRYAQPGVTYIVTTTGHVQTVRDGLVMDQATPNPVKPEDFYLRANKYVREVLEITHVEQQEEDPVFGPAHLLTIPDFLRRTAA